MDMFNSTTEGDEELGTTTENVDEFLLSKMTAANAELEAARASCQSAIDEIDAAIRDKDARLAQLHTRAVSKPDAIALVVEDVRDSLRTHREAMKARAAIATNLRMHASVSSFGVINGDGRHDRGRSPQRVRINLLAHLNAMDLAAMLLDDAAIEAFATDAIAATDAPETARPAAEIAAEAETLADELEYLHNRRHELREQLSKFISIALSPMVPDSFFTRSLSVDIGPLREPKVTRFDESGQEMRTRLGPTRDELNAAADAADRAGATDQSSDSSTYHILGKTPPGAKVKVESPPVPVAPTGPLG